MTEQDYRRLFDRVAPDAGLVDPCGGWRRWPPA